mgnify:CR=1 FL=1
MNGWIDTVAAYGLILGLPLLFLLVVAWVFRPGAERRYRKDGEIPFQDGGEVSEKGGAGVLK